MFKMRLQPLREVHREPDVWVPYEAQPNDPVYSYILAVIGCLILIIACINFTTLTIGRSWRGTPARLSYQSRRGIIASGILQAVPKAPGTEVILESTANGLSGLFCSVCKAAERGDSDYHLIFIPWFWNEEYRQAIPDGWTPPKAFAEYGDLHGLEPAIRQHPALD